MVTKIHRVGNSGVITIPKPLLKRAGLKKEVDIAAERGAIVLRNPRRPPRQGWAQASRSIAEAGNDGLVWPEFGNPATDSK